MLTNSPFNLCLAWGWAECPCLILGPWGLLINSSWVLSIQTSMDFRDIRLNKSGHLCTCWDVHQRPQKHLQCPSWKWLPSVLLCFIFRDKRNISRTRAFFPRARPRPCPFFLPLIPPLVMVATCCLRPKAWGLVVQGWGKFTWLVGLLDAWLVQGTQPEEQGSLCKNTEMGFANIAEIKLNSGWLARD